MGQKANFSEIRVSVFRPTFWAICRFSRPTPALTKRTAWLQIWK